MATMEEPITRTALREELRFYATKEDLANLESRLIRWIAGMMIAGMAGGMTAVAAILRYLT